MTTTETAPQLSVMVIDDEPQIQRLLTILLESEGYRVTAADTGKDGLAASAQRRHDLIILDLGLPDLSGISVLKQIREWTQTPVIILTVQDAESEKIEALDSGADDYVTKPFNSGELLARLRAALRRADKGKTEGPVLHFGNLTINLAARRVMRNGEAVKLTATEYTLLKLFVQHAGKVLTHRHLLREAWGPDQENETQYLRVYVQRLREKLEADPESPVFFLTEPGVGYRFMEP
jgi:two-component system KDP operon response regulator KdpE